MDSATLPKSLQRILLRGLIGKLLYDAGISSYEIAIRLASLKSKKAKQWIGGRNYDWQNLQDWRNKQQKVVWFHCASLGEFEQARPLIDVWKQEVGQEWSVLLTFYSPSGYEIRKDYPLADLVTYMPIDKKGVANKFLDCLQPDFVVWVKYEFWLNTLEAIKSREIPAVLTSAIFHKQQPFFKRTGGIFREALDAFNQIFVQENESKEILSTIGYKSKIAGDVRIDRIADLAKSAQPISEINQFKGQDKLLVVGSNWPVDDILLWPFIQEYLKDWKIVIAPHEFNEVQYSKWQKHFKNQIGKWSEGIKQNQRMIVIDSVGMLNQVYQYADIAYIGGGFGTGIHNILEPAVFGIPILFGPKHLKFKEAQALIDLNVAADISDNTDATQLSKRFFELHLASMEEGFDSKIRGYFDQNIGATELIMSWVKDYLKEGAN